MLKALGWESFHTEPPDLGLFFVCDSTVGPRRDFPFLCPGIVDQSAHLQYDPLASTI